MGEPFRVDGSDVTLTVPADCAQKRASVNTKSTEIRNTQSQDTPPEPLQQKLFGALSIALKSVVGRAGLHFLDDAGSN